ncbi:MAG: dienelactone hydrolase family protein [bacterium]|nr:dienelactone hydrolase family protein [bacterium]
MCDIVSCGSDANAMPSIPVTDEQRRAFLRGLISLPLAVVLAHPSLAKAAGDRLNNVTVQTASGGTGRGYIALPAKTPAPTVLLIHEWWGLNDQIKSVAAEFANQGYVALAVDLYGGKVGTTRGEARTLMQSLRPQQATDELVAWVNWLRRHKDSNGKVGTVGWCFGGGWSLNASIAAPVNATVIYYGNVKKTADQLKTLNSPVLGHFASLDKWINADMVGGFEKAMAAAGKTALTVHWYDANHAFANPTGSRYDAEDARLAWSRTLAFFKKHLS